MMALQLQGIFEANHILNKQYRPAAVFNGQTWALNLLAASSNPSRYLDVRTLERR